MPSTPTLTRPGTSEETSVPNDQAFAKILGAPSDSIASSATHSTVFVKKFLALAISNVAYLRALMPEDSFKDRFMGDLHLKVISAGEGSHPIAKKIIDHVKSCFDAVDKGYLKRVTIWFHEDPNKPEDVMEAYVFKIEYLRDKANVTLTRNSKVLSKVVSGGDIKKSAVEFLKTLIQQVEHLEPLPPRVCLKMQLSYCPGTPGDYQPPNFYPATTKLAFSSASGHRTLDIGTVSTNNHAFHLDIKTLCTAPSEEDVELRSVSEVGVEKTYGLDFDEMAGASQTNVNAGARRPPPLPPASRLPDEVEAAPPAGIVVEAAPPAVVEAAPPAVVEAAPPDLETQLDVRCICGGSQDGEMIHCEGCDKWQHAICYGVFPDRVDGVEGHFCVSCVAAGVGGSCLDPSLQQLTPEALRVKALFRRATLAAAKLRVESMTNEELAHRLSIDAEEAQLLIDQMCRFRLVLPGEEGGRGAGDNYFVQPQALKKFLKDAEKKMAQRGKAGGSSKQRASKKKGAAKRKAQGDTEL